MQSRHTESHKVLKAVRQAINETDWNSRIRKKYGNSCIKCGSTQRVQIHHIVSLAHLYGKWFGYMKDMSTKAKITFMKTHPIIVDLEGVNGEPICEFCHNLHHSKKLRWKLKNGYIEDPRK